MKTSFSQLLFFALMISWGTLLGQNNALYFDGNNDYVTLSPLNGAFASNPNSDFTVEMWFRSDATGGGTTCTGDFRRLFSLGGTNSRFEVGECGGLLSIFLFSTNGPSGPFNMSITSIRDGLWHCLAVVRSGNTVTVWLDGNITPLFSNPNLGTLNSTLFRVGHWGGSTTTGQDWLGPVDEVRLWDVARSFAQLTACGNCLLAGTEPDLLAYWQMDQGVAAGLNTSEVSATDATVNGNNGTFSLFSLVPAGFALGQSAPLTESNFVLSGAPLVYPVYRNLTLEIEHPVTHTTLTEICSGDPVFFCLHDAAGNLVPPGSPVSPVITWLSSVNGSPFSPVTSPSFSPNLFCFGVLPGDLTASCQAGSKGFDDLIYRAQLVVTDPVTGQSCTYLSSDYPLRICCTVPQPTVVLNVQPPGVLNGTLCEGDVVVIDLSLTGLPAWFPPALGSVVTVDWYLNNVPISSATGMTQFSYPITVGTSDLCFSVKIKNCACPLVTAETCIQVDPLPKCGTIIGCHPNLVLVASSPMLCYKICPFHDATVCIDMPFTDCIPHWQFSFDNITWKPLGTSNATQNTNTLPCDDSGSPYEWPSNQQNIYYRIACYPLSYPMPSGCEPCYSNVIKVSLKPAPQVPVITGVNLICKNQTALLSVSNVEAGVTYEWFCNGLSVGFGPTYSATKQACYWVEASNNCQITESAQHCLTVCMVTAVISCPLFPNPCAQLGQEIHLSGCASKSTCGGTLTYAWSASSGSPGTTSTATNLCDFYHIPDASGTTYTLTVTWTNGTVTCTDTATMTVTPCQ